MGLHDRMADCGDALEEVLGAGGGGAWERLDEDNAGVWLLVAGVEALDADGHFGVSVDDDRSSKVKDNSDGGQTEPALVIVVTTSLVKVERP